MTRILIIAFSVVVLWSCNLFEDELSFTSVDDSEITKYIVYVPDSINILECSKYINDNLSEKFKFVYDSVRTQKWTYNQDNELIAKRYYIFENDHYQLRYDTIVKIDTIIYPDTIIIRETFKIDTLLVNKIDFLSRQNAISTIDTIYRNDSIIVIIKDYEYNNDFLSVINSFEYTVGGLYRQDRHKKLFYNSDDNLVKVNYETDQGMCSDEMQYTSNLNLIDIQRFENRLLGQFSTNLVHNAFWEKGCNVESHKVKPSSRYSYEFDAQGYVTYITEEYTPEYKEFVGVEVERTNKFFIYEYVFE